MGSPAAPQTSILPELAVRCGRAAVEFYKTAFGAVEVYRVGGTDAHEAVVSQLSIGAASFWVHDESPANGIFSPEALEGCTVRILLVVEDPDAAFTRAAAGGASEISPVGAEHGWRLGRLRDPFGHHWEIGAPPFRGRLEVEPGHRRDLRAGLRVNGRGEARGGVSERAPAATGLWRAERDAVDR